MLHLLLSPFLMHALRLERFQWNAFDIFVSFWRRLYVIVTRKYEVLVMYDSGADTVYHHSCIIIFARLTRK